MLGRCMLIASRPNKQNQGLCDTRHVHLFAAMAEPSWERAEKDTAPCGQSLLPCGHKWLRDSSRGWRHFQRLFVHLVMSGWSSNILCDQLSTLQLHLWQIKEFHRFMKAVFDSFDPFLWWIRFKRFKRISWYHTSIHHEPDRQKNKMLKVQTEQLTQIFLSRSVPPRSRRFVEPLCQTFLFSLFAMPKAEWEQIPQQYKKRWERSNVWVSDQSVCKVEKTLKRFLRFRNPRWVNGGLFQAWDRWSSIETNQTNAGCKWYMWLCEYRGGMHKEPFEHMRQISLSGICLIFNKTRSIFRHGKEMKSYHISCTSFSRMEHNTMISQTRFQHFFAHALSYMVFLLVIVWKLTHHSAKLAMPSSCSDGLLEWRRNYNLAREPSQWFNSCPDIVCGITKCGSYNIICWQPFDKICWVAKILDPFHWHQKSSQLATSSH